MPETSLRSPPSRPPSLPSSPPTPKPGTKASTIGRRLAAIRYAYKLARISEPPTNSELVRVTLRGIRRSIGAAKAQKTACTADVLAEMLKHCGDHTLLGVRDRALLALGFAGAFRRSEALNLADRDSEARCARQVDALSG